MNDTNAPVKFLAWIVCVVIALGLFGHFGKLTYKVAEMAINAHENHQMSYGRFSRQLWSKPEQKKLGVYRSWQYSDNKCRVSCSPRFERRSMSSSVIAAKSVGYVITDSREIKSGGGHGMLESICPR